MSLLKGSDLTIGVGMENPSARGTFVDPQVFIPGRTPSGINVEVTKTLLKETKPGGIKSQGSVVVQRKAVGDLEFNLRSETIGYLLKSLLGSSTPSVVSGSIKDHLFEVDPEDPQYPTLSLALAQAGSFQDYGYQNALVNMLSFSVPIDDLANNKVGFIATDESEKSAFTPTYSDTDYFFRPQDVSFKIADDVSGLAAATPVPLKELSLDIKNNGRAQQHIGSLTPTDNIALALEITGSLKLDYQDDTYHDLYKDGTYKAMRITFVRSDIDLGTSHYPTITITLAKVSFEASKPDRPLDDIVKDGLDFTAHYDDDEEEAINVVVRNTVTDYDYDAGS